ncbi:MAG: hypothetical protein JW966_12155, partial [Anaerolineae bacterium]|nr:hypothetical protein [Anaerolineae bacterium]
GPFGGLALAMSIATAVESTILWIILRRRIGGINERRVLGGAARTLAASLVMAGAVGAFLALLRDLPLLVKTPGAMAVGGVVFWTLALVFNVDEAQAIPRVISRVILRHVRA